MLRKVTVAQMNCDMHCDLPFLFLIGSLILKGDSSFLQFVPSPLLLVCLWFSLHRAMVFEHMFWYESNDLSDSWSQLHFLFIDDLKTL